MKKEKAKKIRPAQKQSPPGLQSKMKPKPQVVQKLKCGDKLVGKVALITGGDSGIGQAAAVAFAQEGADIAIVYLKEHSDAKETRRLVEQQGKKCLLIAGDAGAETFCRVRSGHL